MGSEQDLELWSRRTQQQHNRPRIEDLQFNLTGVTRDQISPETELHPFGRSHKWERPGVTLSITNAMDGSIGAARQGERPANRARQARSR